MALLMLRSSVFLMGLCPKTKNEKLVEQVEKSFLWNEGGCISHEKEREQEDAFTQTQTHS